MAASVWESWIGLGPQSPDCPHSSLSLTETWLQAQVKSLSKGVGEGLSKPELALELCLERHELHCLDCP